MQPLAEFVHLYWANDPAPTIWSPPLNFLQFADAWQPPFWVQYSRWGLRRGISNHFLHHVVKNVFWLLILQQKLHWLEWGKISLWLFIILGLILAGLDCSRCIWRFFPSQKKAEAEPALLKIGKQVGAPQGTDQGTLPPVPTLSLQSHFGKVYD